MADIGQEFGLGAAGGIHFKEPWLLMPYTPVATSLECYDSGAGANDSATTGFFTEMARRGLQDQTNWTADTYKTLLSVPSGKGLVAGLCGPTAGGAETTTFEFTADGVLTEVAVGPLASGERALLLAHGPTTIGTFESQTNVEPGAEALDADKATFGAVTFTASHIFPWKMIANMAIPCLRFNQSLLIRAKHSASITNSTATAYSFVMYRKGL